MSSFVCVRFDTDKDTVRDAVSSNDVDELISDVPDLVPLTDCVPERDCEVDRDTVDDRDTLELRVVVRLGSDDGVEVTLLLRRRVGLALTLTEALASRVAVR